MSRILFIGLDYFDYPAQIVQAFERAGHTVDYRPIELRTFGRRAFKTLGRRAYAKSLADYQSKLVEDTASQDYDTVLFLQVHQMDTALIDRLRALHPSARFLLYNWDALTTHDYRPWLSRFDAAATFDREDAEALGIHYLPLFAIPTFFSIDRARDKDFDLYFVGSVQTVSRFDALARLHAFAQATGLRTHFHMLANPLMRAKLFRQGKRLPGLTGSGLGFGEIVDLLERSRGTFDFANHRQSGYTMRLIENMCAERKIVTENPRILDEPFYREDRFLLVDGHDFSAVPEFLARPIESELDVHEFSVDSWARKLLAFA